MSGSVQAAARSNPVNTADYHALGRGGANALRRHSDSLQARCGLQRLQTLQQMGMFPVEHERPMGFQLELTHACNLRCKHCYNTSGGGQTKNDMPFEVWERVVDEICEFEPFQVIISGGEPLLLGDKLFQIMDRLNKEPTRFVIITNGSLADAQMIQRLDRYSYYWMQVSIDGYSPELHDAFRGMKGSWLKAVRAAQKIAALNQALVIAHTVTPENLSTLPQMVNMAYVLGATRIICDEAMHVGRAWHERKELQLSDEQRDWLSETIIAKQDEYQNAMEVLQTSDIADSFELYQRTPCNVMLVRPNGDVKLDCVLPFVIGNVQRQSLKEIWQAIGRSAWKHPKIEAFIRSYQENHSFDKCEARPYVNKDIYIGAV